MSNPYQQFSSGGSHSKTKTYTPRLTPQMVIDAVPKMGSITFKQLSRRVGFREPTLRKVLKQIEMGKEIEMFLVYGLEQNFRRVKKDA